MGGKSLRTGSAFTPFNAGYRIAYRANEANTCPGCGQRHWVLGRSTAECAYCGTALPLAEGGMWGIGVTRGRQTQLEPQWAAA